MSLLERMMGSAGKVSNDKTLSIVEGLLTQNERVTASYQLIRDYIVFTDKRVILVDIQGKTGTKKLFQSIPYKSISRFNVETAGTMDMDAELELFISSAKDPLVTLELGRDNQQIFEIAKQLAQEILY